MIEKKINLSLICFVDLKKVIFNVSSVGKIARLTPDKRDVGPEKYTNSYSATIDAYQATDKHKTKN